MRGQPAADGRKATSPTQIRCGTCSSFGLYLRSLLPGSRRFLAMTNFRRQLALDRLVNSALIMPEARRMRGLRQLRTRIKPSGANVSHCHGRIAGGHCPAVAAGRGWKKAGQRLRYDPEPSRSDVVVHEATQRSFDPRCQGGDGSLSAAPPSGSAGAAAPSARRLPITLARLLAGGTVRDLPGSAQAWPINIAQAVHRPSALPARRGSG